ncbi:uncharacterized protein BP5553_04657 [Venustampulla echinocandica]|uniref:Uncharacterized protein n=1 Tax=Venustampulla echinocandica TaxID=2656787 RepID=A0A370TNX4_9HELO|nr:uncharacterized protein BP5553_04657 [Venustampulla echinocandica]RDL37224.1 hypothetical protein BP5553_04657 [Venustampulla echinocandica]
MRSFLALITLGCLSNPASAVPYAKDEVVKRTEIGSGCSWCTPGPWKTDPACSTYEYSAVASSMRNPPSGISFDVTSFCSEFLRPLVTDISIIDITSGTTTSTSTVISLIMFTPTSTAPSTTTTAMGMAPHPHGAAPVSPVITASPKLGVAPAIKKRDFTVPQYLEPWYFYGRLDPGCSCIITSALPSLRFSATETSTHYNITMASLDNESS